MEHCPNCGGELKIIAAILEQLVSEKILRHLGLQARAPQRSPARGHALQAEPGHTQSSGLFVPGEGSGRWPDAPGLIVAYGFSGHGFKLLPAVGKVLAQAALGLATDVSLAPYALERFRQGRLLVGRYGSGAVS